VVVVLEVTEVVEVDDVVEDEEEDEEVVVLRMPLLVGDRKLKTKAATIPSEATTASTLRPGDQRVSEGSSGGGGGGTSASGGGP
jgi:hypothetical protein